MELLKLVLLEGGPGQCIFAINNACNAACDFCSFNRDRLKRPDWIFAPIDRARRAVEILRNNGIRYLVLTGGEPMLHPDLYELIRTTSDSGMKALLVTNGSLLNKDSCGQLAESGLSSIFISIDAHDALSHEKNRGLPKVCERIRRANETFKDLGIQSTASVTMSRLIRDYASLPDFLRELGFESVTFSYPLTHLDSSFLGHAESNLVDFSPQELDQAFEAVKRLKKSFHVANPTASLKEMQRFVRGQKQEFECLGGYRYFYLDWNLQIWRCHHWEKPMGPIEEFDRTKRVRDGCQRCMIDCMRDPSVLQHAAVSVSDAVTYMRRGRLGRAAATLFQRKNATSLKAVWEQMGWFTRL